MGRVQAINPDIGTLASNPELDTLLSAAAAPAEFSLDKVCGIEAEKARRAFEGRWT